MPAESTPIVSLAPLVAVQNKSAKPVRLWPAVALVALFWVFHFIVGQLEKPYFIGFVYGMASSALLALLFFGWLWTNRGIRLSDRLYAFLLIVGGGLIAAPLCHPSIRFGLLTKGLPVVLTAWTLWMVVWKRTFISSNRLGSLAVVALAWCYFTLSSGSMA